MDTNLLSSSSDLTTVLPTTPLSALQSATAPIASSSSGRNVLIFVADGLRNGSVNPVDAPTLYQLRQDGVNFDNSYSLFPTFTTPNASAIATGHYLGDTGDFSNTIYSGFPVAVANGSPTPFIENDPVLAALNQQYKGLDPGDPDTFNFYNFLNEDTLLQVARQAGYNTAAVGKLGPVLIQDPTQGNIDPATGKVPIPQTVILDDSTFSAAGVPVSNTILNALQTAGLQTTAALSTLRVQPSGSNTTPGTLVSNAAQQQYFADATTKAILPTFAATSNPFAMVYWSRDPDGSQHNQGDSLNSLTPGINGPTSKAGVSDADSNLAQIIQSLKAQGLYDNTDIFVTSDHGFSTISKSVVDAQGTKVNDYASTLTYAGVNAGFLPAGFVAIDLANGLKENLFDPDQATKNADGTYSYKKLDPTQGDRPNNGNGLIALGTTLSTVNATTAPPADVIVAANGGSDLVYVPSGDAAIVKKVVDILTKQNYVSGLFVDDSFGSIAGTLPLSSINLKGSAQTPTPAIVINFKTFSTDPNNPVQTQVEIADTSLQQGQGMHGTFGRGDTFNNMIAIGPDFKAGYTDLAPVSNADVAATLAKVLGLNIPDNNGSQVGRVIAEALNGGTDSLPIQLGVQQSAPAANGQVTFLNYQQVGDQKYFSAAGFAGGTVGLNTSLPADGVAGQASAVTIQDGIRSETQNLTIDNTVGLPIVFGEGVAAGYATSDSAILWTRTENALTQQGIVREVIAQVSTDPTFEHDVFSQSAKTDANRDYTLRTTISGLDSGTKYFYRFVSDNSVSDVGIFKTAYAPDQQVPVTFGFTGDWDGQWRPYGSLVSLESQNLDFFGAVGDTIYETANLRSPGTADPLTSPVQTLADYNRKYRENLQAVNAGGFPGTQALYESQGTYFLVDNHELGNKQFINGGAPAGTPAGKGVDATDVANDVNTTGTYINKTPGFQTLIKAFDNYQPVPEGLISAPNDPRTDGTQQQYYAQQWGANALYVNVDDRSYRDIRMKTAAGADDTGARADNPDRTMLGKTQLAWLEQTLLNAQNSGTPWKFIAISSPIDQIGVIGDLNGISVKSEGFATGSDGGKSWMGEYRAERNALLKFIADNKITNVVFLSADDHQNRINELDYSPTGQTADQSTYVRVPGNVFEIVQGAAGAGGPDTITDHSFANIKSIADNLANQQIAKGIDPIGLDPNTPGLRNVFRAGDPNASDKPSPVDFYSPDTFNYATMSISADGKTLSVNTYGILSYAANTFPEPSDSNPVQRILGFELDAVQPGAPVFNPNNLVVSRSVYQGTADTVKVGQTLPGSSKPAIADGTYPGVFNNAKADSSFGITSPIFLDQITTAGTKIGTFAIDPSIATTSFPSKSEVALNLTADGTGLTFIGYNAPVNTLDVSNSNTPGIIEPGNPVTTTPTYREVIQVNADGSVQSTTTNAYPGNNGRAVILGANGVYYAAGNAGNGNGSPEVTAAAGVQIVIPGQNATDSAPGTIQAGSFNITQYGYAPDKSAKDNNFRGETIFNDTLFVSKGSGGNGINTVYQVGNAGTLPDPSDTASTPITILPGFNTKLASDPTNTSFPFGIWFADVNTLYVADEGSGVAADAAKSTTAGLEKWSLINGAWTLDYVLQNGLNLGVAYSVPGLDPTLNPATDGLRNLTGKVNGDGTVSLYAVTSTVSASGDQGADPNRLVAITDNLTSITAAQVTGEKFTVIDQAKAGEVLRGVSFAPKAAVTV